MTFNFKPFALSLCAATMLFAQTAHADCVLDTSPDQAILSSPSYAARYGSQIDILASSDSNECEDYVTDLDDHPTKLLTEEWGDSKVVNSTTKKSYGTGANAYDVDVTAKSSGSALIALGSVAATVYEYGEGLGAGSGASADFVDLIQIENLTVEETEDKYIPVKFCGKYESKYSTMGTNSTAVTYRDYHFNGHAGWDGLIWDPGSSATISHSTTGEICRFGNIKMRGKYIYFSLRLATYGIGSLGQEQHPTPTGTVNINARDGQISATFDLGDLPDGAVCYSASGVFPGCERKIKEPLQCAASFANPINFATGVKHQNDTDFTGGMLSLSRFYRSDAEDLSGALGPKWRHNFDRKANVITTPEQTTVDVTNADGSNIVFSTGSAGDWITTDGSFSGTFEDVLDGSSAHIGYLYTTESDTREIYDLDGLLTRIEYRGGEALDLTYDTSDRLSTVTDEKSKTLTFTYDTSDRISSVATPTGTFSYGYDSNDNLITITKPDTKVLTYHYENTTYVNALTGITDEENIRYATYGYDSEGRAISSEHAGGVEDFSVAYNADGTVTTTNALGKETTYTFQQINGVDKIVNVEGHASANCPAAKKSNTYDANGYLASSTDWNGNVTNYERDARGQVTSRTDDVGGSAERTVTTTYDPSYRLPDVITETGKTTDYNYDSDGRVTSMTVTDTATSETRTTTYSYYANTTDSNGNTVLGKLQTVNGPRTDVTDTTTYTYDSSGRLIKTTNALGHETETTSFDSANRPLTTEDENNVQTTFVYDNLGRVTSSTVASGTALAATTSYTYDDNGNVLTTTLPNGVVMTYTYDNARRLSTITDDIGNSITYTYDDAGNITKEDYKDTGSTLRFTISKIYDELSRVLKSIDANSDERVHAYDVNGNRISTTDGNNNTIDFAFDGLNRLFESTDPLSSITQYSFNDRGETLSVTNARSNETSYSYNAFGDVTQEVSPDRGTINYTHDKAGNVTQMTDARSVVTNYTYDAINRLTAVSYPSDSSQNVTLTYDSASGCGTSKGRLCSVSDASGTTAYIYDNLGRLTSVTETRGSLTFTTGYDYDLAGVLTEITLPSGRTIDYTLNDNGQVSSVSATVNSTATTLASSITYLPFGPISTMSYGNSLTLTNTFNTAYQLTNRTIGTIMNENFTYDDANNITAKGSDSYTLDALNRITGENTDSYTYDAIGNRLTKNTDTYTYPTTSSKLSNAAGDAVTYDAAGNITSDTTRGYTYDAAGRVATITSGGSTVGTYTYDANNLRTKKVAGGNTIHYVYGQGGLLFGEYDSSGDLIREYVYLSGEPLAQIEVSGGSDALTYLHTDHLGTPRYGTNASGTQIWSWDSDAFGNGTPTGAATVNLRFPGQYFDSESSLHYNWNRYYNPETGRYTTSDPIGLKGGLNTFLYSSAQPIGNYDFSGLEVEPDDSIFNYLLNRKPALNLLIPRPMVFGTKIHGMFTGHVDEFGYRPKRFSNGGIADAYNATCGSIYELKPPSYQKGYKLRGALKQINGYIEAAQAQFGNGRAGDYMDIFAGSKRVFIGSIYWLGSELDVYMHPGNSGLVFYSYVETKNILDGVFSEVPESGPVTPPTANRRRQVIIIGP